MKGARTASIDAGPVGQVAELEPEEKKMRGAGPATAAVESATDPSYKNL